MLGKHQVGGKMCKVTIVIPVYNTGLYLKRAIESCLIQTLRDIEIIIVNDGSTDNSLEIAKEYESYDYRVKVVSTENRGLSEARNTGLELAKGKYVYFLDSDDWIEAEAIEQCYNHAAKNNLDLVLFDSKVSVEELREFSKEINLDAYKRDHIIDNPYTVMSGRQFVELYADKRGTLMPAWLVFADRKFLTDNYLRFLPGAYYEDVAFHFSCMMAAERIMYIPRAFHTRTYRDGSIMTSGLSVRKVCSIYEITKELYSSLTMYGKEHDHLWTNYLIRLTRNLYRTVLGNVTRKDIETCRPYSAEILRLQKEAVILYYKVLSLTGEKPGIIRRTLEFIEEVVTPFGWISEEIINIAREVVSKRDKIIYKIFGSLPLNEENKKIGIYGSGKHAEYILRKYKEMLGDIKADLVFIDTYKKSFHDKFYNYDIINIDDLKTVDISEIIILSYLYEDEMYNNIVSRYGNKYKIHKIYNGDKEPIDSGNYLKIYNRLNRYYSFGRKRIILMYTPLHTNIGDHMIAEASFKFFAGYLPDYEVSEIKSKQYANYRDAVVYQTNVDDIVVITGGGFIGSLWPSGQYVYEIVKDFPDNKIVILPQTMYFNENEEGERHKKLANEIFNKHRDLSICWREEISLSRSREYIGENVKCYLMPDMALTLNYSHEQRQREGILLCLRSDREGLLSDIQKRAIKEYFLNKGEIVNESCMRWDVPIKQEHRDEVIKSKINEIKSHKLVITDTLHCMISCAISGTPCIAIDNISSKVKGVYSTWLKDIKYIRFVSSYEDIFSIYYDSWEELHKKNYYTKNYEEYLKRLANIIKGER